MILTDHHTTIIVTLTDQSVEIIEARDETQGFVTWWKDRCVDYNAPRWSPRGADRAIARRLVKQYGLDKLKQIAIVFWRRYSDPLVSGEYRSHMVLFQHHLAEARKDLESIETTAITD